MRLVPDGGRITRHVRKLDDTYFDTPGAGLRLFAIMFRRRVGGSETGWQSDTSASNMSWPAGTSQVAPDSSDTNTVLICGWPANHCGTSRVDLDELKCQWQEKANSELAEMLIN
jgi:hypothetical protein